VAGTDSTHAKAGRREVRREVFKCLLKHEIKFYAVVRNKTDLANFVLQQNVANPAYRFNENEVYHTLTRELFGRLRQTADELNLVFASRGNTTRNQALREALRVADEDFLLKFGFHRRHVITIEAKGSREDPCLQGCDYFMWALQRHFELGESGFIEMLWSKVGEIVDLDIEHGNRRGMTYVPTRPIFPQFPTAHKKASEYRVSRNEFRDHTACSRFLFTGLLSAYHRFAPQAS